MKHTNEIPLDSLRQYKNLTASARKLTL